MDTIRKLIAETAAAKGVELKALSEAMGRNHAYMQQYISRGSPKKLDEDARKVVSEMLGIPEEQLGGSSSGVAVEQSNARVLSGAIKPGAKIPLYGSAVGGDDGEFELNGNRLDYVFAPPSLSGITDAYAVTVVGESMVPRYEDGETIFVNPRRRPVRNDYVIVQIQKEENGPLLAMIKRLVRWTQNEIILEQFNPPKELRFPGHEVATVHYVLKSGE